jgi:hypothetical protein
VCDRGEWYQPARQHVNGQWGGRLAAAGGRWYTARVARLKSTEVLAGAIRICALLAAVAVSPAASLAAGSVSTVSPRPMAMGGAFLAVEDGVASMSWNPAGLRVPLCGVGTRLRVHANALGAASIARETGLLTGVETEPYASLSGIERSFVALGSVAKAVTYRRGSLCLGALLLEERLDPAALARSRGLADAGDLLDGYYSSLAVSFSLAPTVSIGASNTVYAGFDAAGKRVFGAGRAYGALLRPNRLVTVGLTYFDVSPGFEHVRLDLEGLGPRTMNAGVAYRPVPPVLLTVDLRDLSEKRQDTALEPRFGLEWDIAGQVTVRAGAFREQDNGPGVLTLGVGAIPMVGCRGAEPPVPCDAHVLDYAILLSSGGAPTHLLSVLLRF